MIIIKYTVYGIHNKINNKYYIGITSDLSSRWGHHKSKLRHNKHPNDDLQNDFNLCKEENFEFFIIEQLDCNIETIAKKEIYYIEKYNSFSNGYNKTYGGDGTIYRKLTDEQRKKMSDNMLGNTYSLGLKHSKETCHKQSIGMKNCCDMKERKIRGSKLLHKLWETKEFREKMLAKNIGNKYNLGNHASSHTKMILSSQKLGKLNPFYGKKHTKDVKDKLSVISKNRWKNPEYRNKVIENGKLSRTQEVIIKNIHSGRLVKHTYSIKDAINIKYRYLCGESAKHINIDYNKLSLSGLKKICYGTTYSYLPKDKETLYNMLINYQSDEKLLEGLETR